MINKKQILRYLRKHKVIAGVPTIVKFARKSGGFANFKARRGYYVVRWDYILKAFRLKSKSEGKDNGR